MTVEGPGLIFTIISFLVAISVLVFVHEWGHYIVARLFGVRVEVFSIGFGPEIWGRTDRHGTRWKVSVLPIGGYVRFFGDANEASRAREDIERLTPEEQALSFHHKSVGARMAIVAAGPVINFLFAILIYAALFVSFGQSYQPPEVTEVLPDSPAAAAGLAPGDRIVRVAGTEIETARDLVRVVGLYPGLPVEIEVDRAGTHFTREVRLARVVQTDRFGNEYARGQLGVRLGGEREVHSLGPARALVAAGAETVDMVRMMLVATGQVIMGVRSVDDLGGPVRIAKITGEQASLGLVAFIEFIALISINLGLVNLFPIPMLDGGHLLFLVVEGLKGSPLNPRLQELGYLVGLAFILTLMLFLTWNDLQSL
ncbi:MAG: RIP metalloprotease RseP [Rhodothalassiaceae bacterium]